MADSVLVLADHMRGGLAEITFEMLGLGRKVAMALQTPLRAVLLCGDASPLVGQLGAADEVLLVEDPALRMPSAKVAADVLDQVMRQEGATIVVLPGTNTGLGLGSLLSHRSGLPLVNFTRSARVENGQLTLVSQLLGGKILADICPPDNRALVCVLPGAFPAEPGRNQGTPNVRRIAVSLPEESVRLAKFIEPEAGDVDITRQDVLVAVGRGIQNQDTVALAEELAGLMGGAVCASRPVIDQGWLPLSRQVGKSGMTVHPRLYLALGISGAPEHWEGMQSSQCIIAINTDPAAPIFDGAHYGATTDAVEFLPVLIDKVRARKG